MQGFLALFAEPTQKLHVLNLQLWQLESPRRDRRIGMLLLTMPSCRTLATGFSFIQRFVRVEVKEHS